MADEKPVSRFSNGSNSSRSKKGKLNKVPQRGLGVAQLERIRWEEQQQKKDSITIDCSNIRPSFHSSLNSIPLPPPSPNNLPSPHALFKAPSVPSSETTHQNSLPVSMSSSRHGNWPTILNGEHNLGGESRFLDGHRFMLRARSASFLPLSAVPHKSLQFQQLSSSSSSSSMVNSSWGIPLSSPSSLMELSSNQIFHSNYYRNTLSEGDKMVGMKRSYPVSIENPASSSFVRKTRPTYSASMSKSDELASSSDRCIDNPEQRIEINTRQAHSNSSPLLERNIDEPGMMDKASLTGDFLTLAPPECSSPRTNPNRMNPRCFSELEKQKWYDCVERSHKVNIRAQVHGAGGSRPEERAPPFIFFPVKKYTEQVTSHGSNQNGEKMDLSLKL